MLYQLAHLLFCVVPHTLYVYKNGATNKRMSLNFLTMRASVCKLKRINNSKEYFQWDE